MAQTGWLLSIAVSGGNPSFVSSVIVFKTPSCLSSHSIHAHSCIPSSLLVLVSTLTIVR